MVPRIGTGYHRVEGNRRASRNGPVSDLPPEIPNLKRDDSQLCIAVGQERHGTWERLLA
jgi:hypothetical protein